MEGTKEIRERESERDETKTFGGNNRERERSSNLIGRNERNKRERRERENETTTFGGNRENKRERYILLVNEGNKRVRECV